MTLIKKSDVKNHLAARRHGGIHLYRPESVPDATGFAGEGSASADPQTKDLTEKPLHQPAPAQQDSVAASDSSHVAAPVTSKSAQA